MSCPSWDVQPPAYSPLDAGAHPTGVHPTGIYPTGQMFDPRSSSSLSLGPSTNEDGRRRTLLMIYIHGFMGGEASFSSFPAHVHNLLKEALAETHVVHTKIYPRYKTYRALDVARDNFNLWLEPHESASTDVVLVGHSMGGLLVADVVLMQAHGGNPFRHRILGTVSLDTPFLGLHPGIIGSGIASLFRPSPGPSPGPSPVPSPSPDTQAADLTSLPASTSSFHPPGSPLAGPPLYSELAPVATPSLHSVASASSQMTSQTPDPYFNPPFFNDVLFKDRGWLKNVIHFANKHGSENPFEAIRDHTKSYFEFGACLADYPGLHSRYNKLRQLEDAVDSSPVGPGPQGPRRVRFVNYYTMSTGRDKVPKPEKGPDQGSQTSLLATTPVALGEAAATLSDDGVEDQSDLESDLEHIDPIPMSEEPADSLAPGSPDIPPPDDNRPSTDGAPLSTSDLSLPPGPTPAPELALPPIPPPPPPPAAPTAEPLADKAAQKQLDKEHRRAEKLHAQAVKQHQRAVRERDKLLAKQAKKAAKDTERRDKAAAKDTRRREKEAERRDKDARRRDDKAEVAEQQQQHQKQQQQQQQPPRERRFCVVPRGDAAWVPVRMHGVDEVGAHCGLFAPGAHYEALVGDVAGRVAEWVRQQEGGASTKE